MLNNTQKVYERLIRGEFLSDSNNLDTKHLYQDVDENFDKYADFFKQIGYRLERGNGYFFFSSINASKVDTERRLTAFCKWISYLDFLKTFDNSFSVGYQFSKARITNEIDINVDLRDKVRHISLKQTNAEFVDSLLKEMENMGFVAKVDEIAETYKVTSAFRYAEDLVNLITIYNEDEVPQ